MFSSLEQVYPMVLMDEYDQLVLFLHHHRVGDHMDSLLNHERQDVFQANEFYQLFHFELRMRHYY